MASDIQDFVPLNSAVRTFFCQELQQFVRPAETPEAEDGASVGSVVEGM